MQKYENSQDFGISEIRKTLPLFSLLLVIGKRGSEQAMNAECNRAFRASLVDESRFEGSLRLYGGLKYGHNIAVVRARSAQCGFDKGLNGEKKQLLVRAQKLLRNADIGVAELLYCNLNGLFPLVSFLQIWAAKWTQEGNFSFGSAAECADIAVYRRAKTAGPTRLADLTENRLRHSL
jgi:hypothetical protein